MPSRPIPKSSDALWQTINNNLHTQTRQRASQAAGQTPPSAIALCQPDAGNDSPAGADAVFYMPHLRSDSAAHLSAAPKKRKMRIARYQPKKEPVRNACAY